MKNKDTFLCLIRPHDTVCVTKKGEPFPNPTQSATKGLPPSIPSDKPYALWKEHIFLNHA